MIDKKGVFGSLLGLAAEQDETLYQEYSDREVGLDGAAGLSNGLYDSLTLAGMPAADLTDKALVAAGYQLVLGRDAEDIDQEGWDYWFEQLAEGNVERGDFFAVLAAGAFNEGFEGERQTLNEADQAHLVERGDLIAADPDDRGEAQSVVDDLASSGRSSIEADQVDTTVPFALYSLDITAGALNEGSQNNVIEVDVLVDHMGDAETVTFELTQEGATDWVQTVDLSDEARTEQVSVEFDFLISTGYEPGQMELTVTADEDGVTETVSQEFGMYEAEFDQQDLWDWVDTSKQPFDMIGQLVRENEGGDLQIGTGFMISPQHIMTNAHVVAGDGPDDRTADFSDLDNIEFYLGREGVNLREEQGDNLYNLEEIHLQQDDWSGDWPDTDMAVARLDRPVTDLDGQEHFEWFWNGLGGDVERDLVGEDVFWSGYASDFLDQGDDGTSFENDIYFQWMTEGQIDGYEDGAEDFGGASGGLDLSWDLVGTGGASGSPVIRETESGEYEFVGAYVGFQQFATGSDPKAVTLDEVAHDWALTLVQNDGELTEKDFLDEAFDDADLGPSWDSGTNASGSAEFVDVQELDIQGLPEGEDADALLIA